MIHLDFFLSCNLLFILPASIFVIGCLTGSLVGGYQCDILGRRSCLPFLRTTDSSMSLPWCIDCFEMVFRLSMMLDCVLMAAGGLTRLIDWFRPTVYCLISWRLPCNSFACVWLWTLLGLLLIGFAPSTIFLLVGRLSIFETTLHILWLHFISLLLEWSIQRSKYEYQGSSSWVTN